MLAREDFSEKITFEKSFTRIEGAASTVGGKQSRQCTEQVQRGQWWENCCPDQGAACLEHSEWGWKATGEQTTRTWAADFTLREMKND